MQIQNSYEQTEFGKLYVVPTPIGNLDDMTYRAVSVLSEVEVIAAEDTRRTQKLLQHFQIKKRLISYHDHNIQERIPRLLQWLEEGKSVALVSDAGMPAISDPGYELVEAAIDADFPVITLPGANAALSALVGSGLPTDTFLFVGFLPRKKREKTSALLELKNERATLIFYESPNRLTDTLAVMREQLGNRKIALARELTKMYEQYIRGTIDEVHDYIAENFVKGECVLVVAGNDVVATERDPLWWSAYTIAEHVAYYETEAGYEHKEALKLVAQDRNLSRREVYKQIHVDKNE